MISDFRMIHPGLGGHHPRKQDDGYFFLRFFFGSKISQISSCHHPVSNGLRRCLASWCHPGCSMLETDLVHNLNATFWNYLSQALITIILISSYLEGRQYSETLASYHHPMLLGASRWGYTIGVIFSFFAFNIQRLPILWISACSKMRQVVRSASQLWLRSVELHAPSSCSHPGVPQAALLAHGIILASSCPDSKSGNHPGVILWTHVQKK